MTPAKMKPMTNGDDCFLNKRESSGPKQEEESSQKTKEEEGALSVFTFNTERLPSSSFFSKLSAKQMRPF